MAAKKSRKSVADVLHGDVNFSLFLNRILKQVHPDTGIRQEALSQLNAVVNIVGKALAVKADELTASQKKKTCSSRDVQTAVRVILTGELAKHAVADGTKAVTKYNSHEAPKGGQKVRDEVKAGLVVPPARASRFFKSERVGTGARVYLAAVIEYIAAEILELAGNAARDNKKIRINLRHIMLSVENDGELAALFKKLNIHLAAAGVLPGVHFEILPEKGQKQARIVDGKKRSLPGTSALRDIRKQQNASSCTMFSKARFVRLIKHCVKMSADDARLGADAAMAIQMAVEGKLVEFLRNTYEFVIINKRVKLMKKDIAIARKVMGMQCISMKLNSQQEKDFGVKKPVIKRLAHKAAIKTISTDAISEVMQLIYDFVHTVTHHAVASALHHRRHTVMLADVILALNSLGIKLAYSKTQKKSKGCAK